MMSLCGQLTNSLLAKISQIVNYPVVMTHRTTTVGDRETAISCPSQPVAQGTSRSERQTTTFMVNHY